MSHPEAIRAEPCGWRREWKVGAGLTTSPLRISAPTQPQRCPPKPAEGPFVADVGGEQLVEGVPRNGRKRRLAWLRAGLTMPELQRLLGDRTLRSTLAYAELIDVRLEGRMQRAETALIRQVPLAV